MTPAVHQLVGDFLPLKKQKNAKGWWHFDAVCCHHRGHNRDTKGRGNLLVQEDGGLVYNCYNCGFKTGYRGGDLGQGFELLLQYLGAPQDRIQQVKLEILSRKINGEEDGRVKQEWFRVESFPEVELPPGSRPLSSWLEEESHGEELMSCLSYLAGRGRAVYENWDYYWAPEPSDRLLRRAQLHRRVIIPFLHRTKVVGWSARYCGTPPSGVSRYYNSNVPPGYLFNGDVITQKGRKFVIIVEGPFDAISIDAVGALGSTLNRNQIAWLNSTDCEKIVLPDLQAKNQDLIDVALEQGWSVSFPEWERGVKDAADATKRYGRLFTLHSILQHRTSSPLRIGVQRQMLKD